MDKKIWMIIEKEKLTKNTVNKLKKQESICTKAKSTETNDNCLRETIYMSDRIDLVKGLIMQNRIKTYCTT